MQRRITAAAARRYPDALVLRVLWLVLLFLVLVTWSSSANARDFASPPSNEREQTLPTTQDDEMEVASAPTDDGRFESLEMSIPLDDEGIIDIDAPEMGVKIEQWSGNDVLVIVEKKTTKTLAPTSSLDDLNIVVTRDGKNVRIATSGGSDWDVCGVDVSFRIVLPETYSARNMGEPDGLDRVTGILWKAVHRGALKWLKG